MHVCVGGGMGGCMYMGAITSKWRLLEVVLNTVAVVEVATVDAIHIVRMVLIIHDTLHGTHVHIQQMKEISHVHYSVTISSICQMTWNTIC